jgi:putative MATE family efflux protein
LKEGVQPVETLDVNSKVKENKEFIRLLFSTVLPLLIQSLFMQSTTFINQLMMSSLGTTTTAAVSSASKLLTMYNSFLYGSCSGCAMFMAQYWGKGDSKSVQRMLGVTMTATVAVGTLVTGLMLVIPQLLLKLFSDDPEVIRIGSNYLRTVAPAYFLMGVVFPINFTMRSMNAVKVTMCSTIASVIINCSVNYVLIYGIWGFPKMEERGVAIATVATRVVELTFLLTYLKLSGNTLSKNIKNMFAYGKEFISGFASKAVPLIVNEVMWSTGTTVYFVIYGKSGSTPEECTNILAAMGIMQTIQMLAKLFTSSFCSASAIIIGNEIGRADLFKVNRFCKKFHKAAFIVGILSGIAVFLLIAPVTGLYSNQNPKVLVYVKQCMLVLSVYIVMNSMNSINIEGVFRSGGDVKFIAIADMGSIWFIGMPVTLIAGLILRLPVVYIYCAYIFIELYKLPLVYTRFRKGKWIHKLHEISSS